MKKKLKKGFTLVELVIVIAVIAILSAVLIPTFGNVIQNANDSAAFSTASNALTQYTTSMASNHQSTDLPDGYVVVLKDNKTFASGTDGVANLEAKDVAYTFKFEHGALVQYSDGKSAKFSFPSTGIVSLTGKYKATLSDGKFEEESASVTTGKSPLTFNTDDGTVSYFGAYILDGSIKTETGKVTVTGKVILLGNVKTAQAGN